MQSTIAGKIFINLIKIPLNKNQENLPKKEKTITITGCSNWKDINVFTGCTTRAIERRQYQEAKKLCKHLRIFLRNIFKLNWKGKKQNIPSSLVSRASKPIYFHFGIAPKF